MNSLTRRIPLTTYAWLVWIVAALFYAYEFFLRISPSVMKPDLMQTFAIDATQFGLLSGLYYYAYASMQLPVGVLLDTFGIRRLLTLAACAVTVGCLLFATTHSLLLAQLGRILMGIGSAFSFIGCLKLIANWFPEKYLAMVIGLTNTLGVMGAISGEGPLSIVVHQLGWRDTFFIAAICGILIVVLIRLLVRDKPWQTIAGTKQDASTPQHFWDGISRVVRSKRTWLVAMVGGLMVAPVSTFTELWGVPFLEKAHHISQTHAAFLTSIMFIGIAVGGPLHGLTSGLLKRRKPVIWFGCLFALLIMSSIFYLPINNVWFLGVLLFLFGYCISSMLLCFAINSELHPSWATGVSVGFTNMCVMLGGTIFQPLVGKLLDAQWTGLLHDKERLYTLHAYHTALAVLPACLIAALIIIPFISETFCSREADCC
tara:strand:- start:43015 stop:44301 length:1287 start_codon:yes stop_codon:yes gene_type:complete